MGGAPWGGSRAPRVVPPLVTNSCIGLPRHTEIYTFLALYVNYTVLHKDRGQRRQKLHLRCSTMVERRVWSSARLQGRQSRRLLPTPSTLPNSLTRSAGVLFLAAWDGERARIVFVFPRAFKPPSSILPPSSTLPVNFAVCAVAGLRGGVVRGRIVDMGVLLVVMQLVLVHGSTMEQSCTYRFGSLLLLQGQ